MTNGFGGDQAIALIIFITAGIGLSSNLLVVAFISKVQSLQNAFGRLTSSQALAESVILIIFTFLVAPMIFFEVGTTGNIARCFGHVLLICYNFCIYCHVLISLNRMVAVVLPIQYNRVFSTKNTQKMIVGVWTLAITPSIYFYGIRGCDLHHIGEYWRFVMSTTSVCMITVWYVDFAKDVSVAIMIAFFDLFTLYRVHAHNVSSHQNRGPNELNFLNQTCIQGASSLCQLLTYFVISNYFENRYIKFFLTTFLWIVVHSADGFITLYFNRGFHQIWKKSSRKVESDVQTSMPTMGKVNIHSNENIFEPNTGGRID